MKLTRIRIVILFISAIIGECAALVLIFALLASAEPSASARTQDIPVGTQKENTALSDPSSTSGPSFDIKAEIQVAGRLVSIREDILIDERRDVAIVYLPSINHAHTEIINVSSDGTSVEFDVKDAYLEVYGPIASGKLSLEYKITLADNLGILSCSDGRVVLSNFLATPAVYRDGSPILTFKYDYGDPYIYNVYDYHITFKAPKGLTVFAPGKQQESVSGDVKITIFEARNLRDFSSVLLDDADIKTERIGSTIIYYIDSFRSAPYAGQAFRFAEENIGPYPHDELFIIRLPLKLNGMELSNMILLSDSCFENEQKLKGVVYHEVFHQWFYNIIGTDQINEPFFDEGLANYLAMYLSNYKPAKNAGDRFLNLALKDYRSKAEYYKHVYNDAAAYFGQLHNKLGDDFFPLLQKVYAERKFTILYFEDFLKQVEEYVGRQ